MDAHKLRYGDIAFLLDEDGERDEIAPKVFRATLGLGRRAIAVKLEAGKSATPARVSSFWSEIELQHDLSSDYIVTTLGGALDTNSATGELRNFVTVTELADGGTLASMQVSMSMSPVPLADRLRHLRDAALGLRFLHASDIIHGSLSPSTVLLGAPNAKLSAEGLLRVQRDGTVVAPRGGKDRGGAAAYADPLLQTPNGGLTKASDVYAWSILAYEVLTGERAFGQCPTDLALHAHVAGGGRLNFSALPSEIAPWMQPLLLRCQCLTAKDRPTAGEVCKALEECGGGGPASSPTSTTCVLCRVPTASTKLKLVAVACDEKHVVCAECLQGAILKQVGQAQEPTGARGMCFHCPLKAAGEGASGSCSSSPWTLEQADFTSVLSLSTLRRLVTAAVAALGRLPPPPPEAAPLPASPAAASEGGGESGAATGAAAATAAAVTVVQPQLQQSQASAEASAVMNKVLAPGLTLYGCLGVVATTASAASVRAAFLALFLQFHPETNASSRAREALTAVVNAFLVLSDPFEKEKYDDACSSSSSLPPPPSSASSSSSLAPALPQYPPVDFFLPALSQACEACNLPVATTLLKRLYQHYFCLPLHERAFAGNWCDLIIRSLLLPCGDVEAVDVCYWGGSTLGLLLQDNPRLVDLWGKLGFVTPLSAHGVAMLGFPGSGGRFSLLSLLLAQLFRLSRSTLHSPTLNVTRGIQGLADALVSYLDAASKVKWSGALAEFSEGRIADALVGHLLQTLGTVGHNSNAAGWVVRLIFIYACASTNAGMACVKAGALGVISTVLRVSCAQDDRRLMANGARLMGRLLSMRKSASLERGQQNDAVQLLVFFTSATRHATARGHAARSLWDLLYPKFVGVSGTSRELDEDVLVWLTQASQGLGLKCLEVAVGNQLTASPPSNTNCPQLLGLYFAFLRASKPDTPSCKRCTYGFHILRLRHTCRLCGDKFCGHCMERCNVPALGMGTKFERVCVECVILGAPLPLGYKGIIAKENTTIFLRL